MKRDLSSMLSGSVMPGDAAHNFINSQLNSGEPQLPQYDAQAGMRTAKKAALFGANLLPGAGTADALGAMPNGDGGNELSLLDNWRKGNYGTAAMQGASVAGDAAYAVPGLGAMLAGALKAPLAAKMAMAGAPMARGLVDAKIAQAGLADRVMENWGSKHAFEAKNAAKVEAMGDRASTSLGKTRYEATSPTVFREMANTQGDEAVLKAVRRGDHLKPDGLGGYIGAPRTIDSPQALGNLRKKLDSEITNSAEAVELGDPSRLGTWYQRAKGAMAATNEPHQLQGSLSAHGAYSAGVSPESELGFSLKHQNSRALGEPGMAFRKKVMDTLDKATAQGVPAKLAEKTDEYRNKLDPRMPVSGLFGVNDFRAAQNFGFTNKQGKPWKAAVTGTMHPFMDAETALLTDRMNKVGAGDKVNWNGPQMQELPWVYGKAQDLYERGKNARFKGDPIEGRMAAIREANNTFEDYLPKHAMSATHEAVPSGQIDHVNSVLGMPYEARQDYGNVGRWDVEAPVEGQIPGQEHIGAGPRDAIYSAMGLRQMPSVPSVGAWMEEGRLQNNPLTIARPLVDFPTGGGGGSVAPLTNDAVGMAELFRAAIDAQAAGAANMPNTMNAAKNKTGVLLDTMPHGATTGVQPSAEQLAAINEAAGQYGYGASASNRGVLVYPYGDGTSGAASKIMNDPNITEQIPGATPERARPNTVYQQAHVVDGVPEPQSKGVVTSKVLNAAAQLPPTVAQNLSESDSIRNIIGQKIARDDMLPGARPDIQNMRRFFRDADWSKAVDMIRKGAAPAAAAAALGYSLDAMAADRPEARR